MMKAISLQPHTTNVRLTDVAEPVITTAYDIKVKVLAVGICGTDREEISGGRADAPPGKQRLIIGHEMFGQVVETGDAVTKARVGDYGVFMVRRGCGKCAACLSGRSDMCYTGKYRERGIKEADGYQSEYVVDDEQFFVAVPASMKDIGVLTEPMSVAAKAIDEALTIQAARMKDFTNRDSWIKGKKALIAGIGPIGLLAAFALRHLGAEVYGMDIVDESSLRVAVLKEIGGRYINGNDIKVTDIDDKVGQMDLVFEAAGIASLQIQLIDTLGINGIYVATGIPGDSRMLNIDGGMLMQQLVLKNQVVVGSVNASIHHFEQAVSYLQHSLKQYPAAINKVITRQVPYRQYEEALMQHSPEDIKVVVRW